jgi:hypothetical protein
VASIASIDLPKDQWPSLMPELLQNVNKADNLPLVQCSLDALGYVCDTVYGRVRNLLSRTTPTATHQALRGGKGVHTVPGQPADLGGARQQHPLRRRHRHQLPAAVRSHARTHIQTHSRINACGPPRVDC